MFMPGIWSGFGEAVADGMGMFIPGMFICGCGEAADVGEAAGIFMPGIFCIDGLGAGEGLGAGVGEGIGIVCLCCAFVAGIMRAINARILKQLPQDIGLPFKTVNRGRATFGGTRIKWMEAGTNILS